jgi:hypothetical protein
MGKQFTKELNWVSYDVNPNNLNEVIEVEKTATVTFNSLNRTDRSQHKLHFKIISLFEGMGESQKESLERATTEYEKDQAMKETELGIKTDVLYDITVKAVALLVVCDDNFTEHDKKELLNDSIALLNLGLWLFGNEFAPFFQKLVSI